MMWVCLGQARGKFGQAETLPIRGNMRALTKALTLGVLSVFIVLMVAQAVTPQTPITDDKKRKLGNFDPTDIFPTAREGLKEKDKKKQQLTVAPTMEVKRVAPPPNRAAALARPNSRKGQPSFDSVASASSSPAISPMAAPTAVPLKNETVSATEAVRENPASTIPSTNPGTGSIAGPAAHSSPIPAAVDGSKASTSIEANVSPSTDNSGSRQGDKVWSLVIILILFVIALITLIAMIIKLMRLRARVS